MSSYLGYPLAQTGPTRSSANHWQPVFQHQFSQELQANVETGNLHAVFGLFYLDETIEVENHIGFDVLTNTDPFRVQFDGSLFIEAWAALRQCDLRLSRPVLAQGRRPLQLGGAAPAQQHRARLGGAEPARARSAAMGRQQVVGRFLALARRRVPARTTTGCSTQTGRAASRAAPPRSARPGGSRSPSRCRSSIRRRSRRSRSATKYAIRRPQLQPGGVLPPAQERAVLAHPADPGAAVLHQHADQRGGIGRPMARSSSCCGGRRPHSRSTPSVAYLHSRVHRVLLGGSARPGAVRAGRRERS